MRLLFWQTAAFEKNQEFCIIAGQKIAAVKGKNNRENKEKNPQSAISIICVKHGSLTVLALGEFANL